MILKIIFLKIMQNIVVKLHMTGIVLVYDQKHCKASGVEVGVREALIVPALI